jgi:hypothetical protein
MRRRFESSLMSFPARLCFIDLHGSDGRLVFCWNVLSVRRCVRNLIVIVEVPWASIGVVLC